MKKTLVGGVTAEFMRVDPHRLHEDLAINQVKRWLMKREFSKWVSKPTKL